MPVCMREMSNHLQVVYDGLPVVSIDQLTLQASSAGCFECAGRSHTISFPMQGAEGTSDLIVMHMIIR